MHPLKLQRNARVREKRTRHMLRMLNTLLYFLSGPTSSANIFAAATLRMINFRLH